MQPPSEMTPYLIMENHKIPQRSVVLWFFADMASVATSKPVRVSHFWIPWHCFFPFT